MESAGITEIIFEIIDNACAFPSISSLETDEKYVNEIIAQIIDMAFDNYALCADAVTSNEDCFDERDTFNIEQAEVICSTDEMLPKPFESNVIGIHDKPQVIVSTMETIPDLFQLTAIEFNDENREIAELTIGENTERVSTITVGLNDENQVVIPTSETFQKLYESSATEINDKDQMIVSTDETLLELSGSTAIKINDENQVIIPELFVSTAIETNDENKSIAESTVSANTETALTVAIGKNEETKVIPTTAETLQELSESENIATFDEIKVIAQSTASVNTETVSTTAIGNVENQIIVLTAETLPKLFESTVNEYNDEHVNVSTAEALPELSESTAIEINRENPAVFSALETIPEIPECEAFKTNDENKEITESTLSVNTENVCTPARLTEPDDFNDENQISVPTETLPELSEAKAIDNENEVLTESVVSAESLSTAAVISSSPEAGEGNAATVDRSLEYVTDVQHAIEKTIGNGNLSTDDFYTDELLGHKGYNMEFFTNKTTEKSIFMINLSLPALTPKTLKNCEVLCSGLPFKITVNELIPLLEKVGEVKKLRMVENKGCAYVTYTTEEDAQVAIKTLNGQTYRGRELKVRKFFPNLILFVTPIPYAATRAKVQDEFKRLANGLEKVLLLNSFEDKSKNRGFCYLEYESYRFACEAKAKLWGKTVFGQKIFCYWPEENHSSDTLYISNLGAGVGTAELRKHFSVFGEVIEIDKYENSASLLFRKPEDSKRALREIDKTKLGNENVEVSDFLLKPPKMLSDQIGAHQGKTIDRFDSHYETRKSYATTAATTQFGLRNDYIRPNENTFRSAYDERLSPRTTKNNSFGATSVRRDTPPMTFHPDPIERHPGPRNTMTSNQSTNVTTNERYGTRHPMTSNQSTYETTNDRYGRGKGGWISKENSFRSDAIDRHDSRKNNFGAGPAEQYGTRKDTMTSNTSSSATKVQSGPRLGILTSDENTIDQGTEKCGPPKSKSAGNAFRQSEKHSKKH